MKSDQEKLADAIDGLRCVIVDFLDTIKGSSGKLITGIHALTVYKEIVGGKM